MTVREVKVYMAKLAEQAERYEEMVKFVKEVAEISAQSEGELSVEERNLLSVAYKNVIGARRASWRVIQAVEGKDQQEYVTNYKATIEDELVKVCNEVLSVIENNLLENAKSGDGEVFYRKMMGDYHRYMAEFQSGAERKESAAAALVAYEKAFSSATRDLAPTHPIRLGLALNFSVFHYEILNSPAKACRLAKQAFDDAIAELDTLSEESYKDSTLIMQLLRDNLTLWTSDVPDDQNEQEMHVQDM